MRPAALVALALCAACSEPTAAPSDAAVVVDAAVADLAVDPNGPLGFVTLGAAPSSSTANATFLASGSAFLCSQSTDGNCTFYDCHRRPPPDGGQPAVQPNPGTIDVTGASKPVHFVPAVDGYYDTVHVAGALFGGSELLHVVAAGGTVPAFAGDVRAPAPAGITAPTLPAGDWKVDRSASIAFTWTGLTEPDREDLLVTFGADSVDPVEVECVFPGATGSGIVSAASLAHLPAGAGYFEVKSRRDTLLRAGSWQVTFRADDAAISTSGKAFTGSAVFQ